MPATTFRYDFCCLERCLRVGIGTAAHFQTSSACQPDAPRFENTVVVSIAGEELPDIGLSSESLPVRTAKLRRAPLNSPPTVL